MSEVKGTLLGIVLAISVFTIVFTIVTIAVRENSNTIAGRMKDSAEIEPDVFGQSSVPYTIPNY